MSETIEELKKEILRLERSNQFLQDKINLYEMPSPNRAFYVAQKMLNQQVNYLDKFKLEDEIKVNPKEDKIYDRSMDLFEKLTANASKLNTLKYELGLSGDEKKDTEKKSFTDRIAESRT